jgi:hypothetical protein
MQRDNACVLGISDGDLKAFFDLALEIFVKALTHSSDSSPVVVWSSLCSFLLFFFSSFSFFGLVHNFTLQHLHTPLHITVSSSPYGIASPFIHVYRSFIIIMTQV